MKIAGFTPFNGQHCETTATGSLLYQLGIELSEPMLFGLGEGLSYIFWNMKSMDFPFIGGRVKPDLLTENICRNLNLQLEVNETTSVKKAWKNVTRHLDKNKAVGLKLDCYHLDYFTTKIHFAGHYASIYGYDDKVAYLNDTNQQGRNATTTLESLALARNERGPMSSRNRSYIIHRKGHETTDLKTAVKMAIDNNCAEFLNPPISNISYKGIFKTATAIKKWFSTSENIQRDFQTTATLMERAGTGGSLFRRIYRDFLAETAALFQSERVEDVKNAFDTIAQQWTTVSDLLYKAGETENIAYINRASALLIDLSQAEENAMKKLQAIQL